jgi:hypothetical protein
MQRSFTQQMQELASYLLPTKKAATKKMGTSKEPQHSLRNDGISLANPPPPPLEPDGDSSSSVKVHGTKRRSTKVRFNGSIKNYKEGVKRQQKSSKIK